MEGNECYKFSTIRHYLQKTNQKEVEIVVDVGAHDGSISLMMKDYFPKARIYAYEAVTEYHRLACANTQHVKDIFMLNKAVTSVHMFADDLGEKRRKQPARLTIFKGLPQAGPGWRGGSVVLALEDVTIPPAGFERIDQEVEPVTLSEIWGILRKREAVKEIDLVKFDCEGCECSALGCADSKTLSRIRFIVGEYHDIERFYRVMQRKLFLTHKVNLIGSRDLGCFFAERIEKQKDGILKYDKTGMLILRPWLSQTPIDWHLFNEEFVLPEDRHWHALQ